MCLIGVLSSEISFRYLVTEPMGSNLHKIAQMQSLSDDFIYQILQGGRYGDNFVCLFGWLTGMNGRGGQDTAGAGSMETVLYVCLYALRYRRLSFGV